MADPTTTLRHFTHDLPDPHEELFYQPLSSFTLFPKLPPEIRSMIWQATFPRNKHFWWFHPGKPEQALAKIQPPISSRINCESRKETLQHYQVLRRRNFQGRPSKWYPFVFFNKDRDVIRSASIVLCQDIVFQFWQEHFLGDHLNFIGSVATIEMTHGPWHQRVEQRFHDKDMEGLKTFTGLKQLRIIDLNYDLIKWLDDVGSDADDSDGNAGSREEENDPEKNQLAEVSAILRRRWVEHCIEYFSNFFKEQAAKNLNCYVPNVSILLEPWFVWVGNHRV